MHEAGYVDSYLEHLVPLPKLDIIICPFLDYYILSIFHNLGSPLSYHTLIFYLMSSRNIYLYNAYILFKSSAYGVFPINPDRTPIATCVNSNKTQTYRLMY